jgi:hypothetical protein
MDSLGIAETVVIRHRCHCTPVAESPEDGTIEHVFTVNGEDFPWYISERGPMVARLADDWYTVDVEILLLDKNPNSEGKRETLGFRYWPTWHVPYIPVIGGREFPWTCTDDEITLRFSHKMIPTLALKFFARSVDAKGIEIEDKRPQWVDRALYRAGGDLVKCGLDECHWCHMLTDNVHDHIIETHPERCRGSEVMVSG